MDNSPAGKLTRRMGTVALLYCVIVLIACLSWRCSSGPPAEVCTVADTFAVNENGQSTTYFVHCTSGTAVEVGYLLYHETTIGDTINYEHACRCVFDGTP